MGQIEFVADAGEFRAVKKMKVEETTEPMDAARFLASLQGTLVRKTHDYMAKDLPLAGLDDIAGGVCGAEKTSKGWQLKGRLSEEAAGAVLAKARGHSVTKQVNELVKGKHAQTLAKEYVLQRVLDILGFPLSLDTKLFDKFLEEKALAE